MCVVAWNECSYFCVISRALLWGLPHLVNINLGWAWEKTVLDMLVPYSIKLSLSDEMCCFCLPPYTSVQHNKFDIRDIWKSVFNRDLSILDNALKQEQTLGAVTMSETLTKVTRPKRALAWMLLQQNQGKLHKGCALPWLTQSSLCAIFSTFENISSKGKREEITRFPLQPKEITLSCPKETCSEGLTALKSVSERTLFCELGFHIWWFFFLQLTSLTFSVTSQILVMTPLLLPPNWKVLFMDKSIYCKLLLPILHGISYFS